MKRFIFLLLLVSISLACLPGWEENLSIRVLDKNLIPIKNATVTVTFQRAAYLSNGYTTTNPVQTDENGVANIHLKNIDTYNKNLDCSFLVNVSYDNKKASKEFIVGSHPNILDFTLDAYLTKFYVYDQNGNPLENAHISVDDFVINTNNLGNAEVVLGTGEKEVMVDYKGGKIYQTINVDKEKTINISFNQYPMTIKVIDDFGKPLNATLFIEGNNYFIKNGIISFENIHSRFPNPTVEYKGIKKKINADLSLKQQYTIVYDFNAPNIGDINVENQNGSLVLTFSASDPGTNPSGIDEVLVTTEKDGIKRDAYVYMLEDGIYTAQLGEPEEGLYVVNIEIKDADGNIDYAKVSFSVKKEKVKEEIIKGSDLPIVWLVGAILGIGILLIAVGYVREKIEV